jgi:murein DD-endopeptidase
MDNKNLRMRLMLEAEKEIVSGLNEAERYRYFLGRMQFLRYESGKENMISSDCSGSVCLALLLATGCSIRVTADALFKKYFTKKNPEKNDIQAAFFITLYDRKLGTRLYKENEVCHVAGVCGTDVVLNCVEPYSVLRSLSDMKPFYQANDYRVVVRGLDREALQKASDDNVDLFGADYQFMQIREAIDGDRK